MHGRKLLLVAGLALLFGPLASAGIVRHVARPVVRTSGRAVHFTGQKLLANGCAGYNCYLPKVVTVPAKATAHAVKAIVY